MAHVESDLPEALQAYGALPSQLVDLSRGDEPRLLSYLDLCSHSQGWRRPTVVESSGRPCVHVFDGREEISPEQLRLWCRRITLRGDGAWVGVLEPGVLRIYRTEISNQEVRAREVETAEPGSWALPKFLNDLTAGNDDIARRSYLKRLMDGSAQDAVEQGLSQVDALSLVGRGLFWRFLVDRKLLEGTTPSDICVAATSWEECLDNKTHALRTFAWLDQTFNGGLLPFEKPVRNFNPEVFSRVLGNIAHGATESGQLRLPTDWQEVNFSFIPVGLLSEVYEAFAHSLNPEEAAENSIHYTPSHLVDFIVSQALEQLPEGGKPRLLDPAAGAGVFLVTAFRKLVERKWAETGRRPRRRRIREILNRQLCGFDIDSRALRLAELALYLTALELDPQPEPLSELAFEDLRGRVLFDLSQVEHGSLGPVEERFRQQFDLVIGNPPWTAKAQGKAAKTAWVKHSKQVVRERLGEARAKKFDFPDTNTDLPFVWRAMEWAKPGGRIALVTHARWLFGISEPAKRARNDLLQATRVTGILNGSALRKTKVWPEIDAPWCVLFATNEPPEPFDRAAFQFVSPALEAAPDPRQARMRVDWLDAQIVLAQEVVDHPWALKARFRGNPLAARSLESMLRAGEPLRKYLEGIGRGFRNGYKVSGKRVDDKKVDGEDESRDAAELLGMADTRGAGPLGFLVDTERLPKFALPKLHRPRDPSIYRAPLLLVNETLSSDRLAPRASRAHQDVVFHESYHGLSLAGVPEASLIARYLQLWLQSAAMVFAELLVDGRYGVERDGINQESLGLLPFVPHSKLSSSQRERLLGLSDRLADRATPQLVDEIDDFVFDVLDLAHPERQAVGDTLETALPSTVSKKRAVAGPSSTERERFIATLADSLGNVLSASRLTPGVRERGDLRRRPWRILEVAVSQGEIAFEAGLPLESFLEEADENGASLVVVRASASTWFVGLLERYALWTPTRARLLAADLIAERSSG